MLFLVLFFTTLELSALKNNYLSYSFLKDKKLKLVFNSRVGKVKHFTIKGKGVTKHVYDIQNATLPRGKNLSRYKAWGIKVFRIGQYKKNILRVVIESTVPMRGKFKVYGRKLVLYLPKYRKGVESKVTKKRYKVDKSKSSKKYSYNFRRKYKTIILDAGHGGRDGGASSKYVREKDLTLSMTLKLKNILQKMGYKVRLTRDRDKSLKLKQRTDYASRHKGSIFVSIHANAAPRKKTRGVRYEGMEVFYLSLRNTRRVRNKRVVHRAKRYYTKRALKKMVSPWKVKQSRKLAKSVRKNILTSVRRKYKINDKGIKRKDFWVLLANQMPAILVETGYLTHKNEVKKLKNSHYQTLLMEGVANGINRYYGLY